MAANRPATELRAAEVRAAELRAAELRAAELRAAELRAAELRADGAAIGADEAADSRHWLNAERVRVYSWMTVAIMVIRIPAVYAYIKLYIF